MKKIVLLYAKFGGGHYSAANSIKNYLEKIYWWKYEVKIIDFFSYMSKIINKTVTSTYLESLKYFPRIYGRIYKDSNYGRLSKVVKHTFDILSFRMKSLLLKEKPDIVVSCHPYSSHLCANVKKKNKINFSLATIITDFAIHEQRVYWHENMDYIFVSHEKMKNDLISKWVDKNKIYITWIPISSKFLNKFNSIEIKKSFWLDDKKKTILFFWGWEFGISNMTIIKILKKFISYKNGLQIVVIAWRNERLKLKFEKLVKKTKSENFVKILGFTDKVPELMSVSDLIVSKPGWLTTSESLASGLPMLLINPIPWQEVDNAEFLEWEGAWVSLDKNNYEEVIENILSNPDILIDMRKNAKAISKINSTWEICKILNKLP